MFYCSVCYQQIYKVLFHTKTQNEHILVSAVLFHACVLLFGIQVQDHQNGLNIDLSCMIFWQEFSQDLN